MVLSIKAHLENRLAAKGLKKKDFPKAILIHEILGLCFLALTWTTCYYLPPSQIPLLKVPFEKMVSLIPENIKTNTPSYIKGKVGSAYLESSCLRKILRPFSIPAKMVITYNIVSFMALQEKISSSSFSSTTTTSTIIKKYKKKNKDIDIIANKISTISSSSSSLSL